MASVAELLAQIHADVHDLGARAVYADALLEAGDPRGELIALQLERTRSGGRPTDRERELVLRHQRAWLGPLDELLADVELENGFLYRAELLRRALTAALVDRPEWSTLEHLIARYEPSDAPDDWLELDEERVVAVTEEPNQWALAELIARLPQLATLEVHASQLDAIRARVRGHALARLCVTFESGDTAALEDMLDARTFDRLRWLRLLTQHSARTVGELLEIARRAGSDVELELTFGMLAPAMALAIEQTLRHVRAITVFAAWGRIRATPDGDAFTVALSHWAPTTGDLVPPVVRDVLRQLGGPGRVIVQLPPGIPPHAVPSLVGYRFAQR